ncbi:MAG: UDP-N-acetylglucosamine 1-carboxyvinyltransferase [Bacilli bacterium]|nr:UDP-N-acetylglucosamine 1-carboxyvinyltransferase [Bacilli bacterium]
MEKFIIEGGHTLTGTINISGAKNSAVALIPAAVLCDEEVKISNIPNISDIDALIEILIYLGAEVKKEKDSLTINSRNIKNKEIPENISKKLRASYYFMGVLLGKYSKVDMFFPGGCNIGSRPINLHLNSFKTLGAQVNEKNNQYSISADQLIGTTIYLDIASVGATINTIFAAVKAKGMTIIENAAKEPEIVNVVTFLNNMGAKITGAGTSEIRIVGVDYLHKCYTEVIPDRIEAGTYLIAAAMIGKNVRLQNVIPEHLEALVLKLKEAGVKIFTGEDYYLVSTSENLKPINIKTMVFPGFATDLQQPISSFLTQCEGKSLIEETIYENRFQNLEYLKQMGADIKIKDRKAYIKGKTELVGMEVEATDLRAGACLILAALIAKGTTTIKNIEHILRGYENIKEKLEILGAKITIE